MEYVVYKRFKDAGKEMAEAFKAKCAAEGIPQAQIIKRAIEKFLNA